MRCKVLLVLSCSLAHVTSILALSTLDLPAAELTALDLRFAKSDEFPKSRGSVRNMGKFALWLSDEGSNIRRINESEMRSGAALVAADPALDELSADQLREIGSNFVVWFDEEGANIRRVDGSERASVNGHRRRQRIGDGPGGSNGTDPNPYDDNHPGLTQDHYPGAVLCPFKPPEMNYSYFCMAYPTEYPCKKHECAHGTAWYGCKA